jgi:hypothetical protein
MHSLADASGYDPFGDSCEFFQPYHYWSGRQFRGPSSKETIVIRAATIVAMLAGLPIAVLAQTPPGATPDAAVRRTAVENLTLDAPAWLKDFRFAQTKFTFVRIQFDDRPRRSANGLWATDYPDADLNLVAQLGRLTKLDVSQPSRVMRFTDPAIADYPLVYVSEPSKMSLSEAESGALRKYLDAGGFLVIDDFWGAEAWQNVQKVMKQVFPDREPVDLPLGHPLFHCVFDLKAKPQVLSIHAFISGRRDGDAPEAHYRAIQDSRGRVVALICHNTDLADGWERVGIDPGYTREMSVARAFPMGINIVYFALTQAKKSK